MYLSNEPLCISACSRTRGTSSCSGHRRWQLCSSRATTPCSIAVEAHMHGKPCANPTARVRDSQWAHRKRCTSGPSTPGTGPWSARCSPWRCPWQGIGPGQATGRRSRPRPQGRRRGPLQGGGGRRGARARGAIYGRNHQQHRHQDADEDPALVRLGDDLALGDAARQADEHGADHEVAGADDEDPDMSVQRQGPMP